MKQRMVDRIGGWEAGRWMRGVKAVSFEEYMMRRGLGAAEVLPESLMLGALVELAGWLVMASSEFREVGVMAGVERFEVRRGIGPGERMMMEVRVREMGEGRIVVDGVGRRGAEVVAEVMGLSLAVRRLEGYYDAGDLRVLWSEIHRPEAAV